MQKVMFKNAKGHSVIFDRTPPFKFGYINGIARTGATAVTSSVYDGDGEEYDHSELEKKQIELGVIISTETMEQLLRAREELIELINPSNGEGELTYWLDGEWVKARVVADGIPDIPVKRKRTVYEAEIIFLMHDPKFYKESQSKGFSTTQGGLHFPLVIPSEVGVDLGYRVINVVQTINNEGHKPCGIQIKIKAAGIVINPTITNITNNQVFRFSYYTMSAGETIIINNTTEMDCRINSIKGDVEEDIINDFDITSKFIKLDVGENTLKYSADVGEEQMEVSIDFTPRYLGI